MRSNWFRNLLSRSNNLILPRNQVTCAATHICIKWKTTTSTLYLSCCFTLDVCTNLLLLFHLITSSFLPIYFNVKHFLSVSSTSPVSLTRISPAAGPLYRWSRAANWDLLRGEVHSVPANPCCTIEKNKWVDQQKGTEELWILDLNKLMHTPGYLQGVCSFYWHTGLTI